MDSHKCARCDGGFIEVLTLDGSDAVRPCGNCNPGAFGRWVDGHFGPDHDADRCLSCNGRVAQARAG